ncbi:MAG TPA: hypothetical protein VEX18_17100, partial [Polyangiaceae bacterium]|nr:hypothetical protein [Polyangiaceae bacterium]
FGGTGEAGASGASSFSGNASFGGGGGGGVPGTQCPGGAGGPPGSVRPWVRRTDLTEATSCTDAQSDECACNGLACPSEQQCLQVIQPAPSAIGGADSPVNGCFALCQADADCEAPSVCVGNLYGLMVCSSVACRSDGDCTASPCGSCSPGYLIGHAGAIYSDPSRSVCYYPE